MNVLFLSMMIPKNMDELIRKTSKQTMTDAANALEWHIYDGIAATLQDKIKIINLLPIGSYPQYFVRPFVRKQKFPTEYRNDHINIGFCNVKLLRKILQPISVYRVLKEELAKESFDWIVVYTLSPTVLRAVDRIKKLYPKLQVCAIVADLPEFTSLSENSSTLHNIFMRYQVQTAYKCLDCIDKYVLLTKYMAERLKIEKPFCVMEGIATKFPDTPNDETEQTKIIMYSGTLHRKFGVMNLVDAFSLIKGEDYKLVICGTGDSSDKICEKAKNDQRIKFLGQLPREEVLRWQSKSTVLVNPRQNNEEFTKYSFPSKTMEYLSSGKPVIAYKLDGIPDEYDQYLQYVAGNTVDALKEKMLSVCNMSYEQRKKIGQDGRMFVMTQKNCVAQANKILDMLCNQ